MTYSKLRRALGIYWEISRKETSPRTERSSWDSWDFSGISLGFLWNVLAQQHSQLTPRAWLRVLLGIFHAGLRQCPAGLPSMPAPGPKARHTLGHSLPSGLQPRSGKDLTAPDPLAGAPWQSGKLSGT